MQRVFHFLFTILFFLTPLILWPFSSEIFEFNKMVFVYGITAIITASWVIRMIQEKRFIFRRTILDIPLSVFLLSQSMSTLFSINPRVSTLGYYSYLNGGLLSSFCYVLLYWAFVSNMDRKSAVFSVQCSVFSAAIVAVYGILEHFGIDKNIWVQDVQNRVFSTLGQPNRLAAWLVALMPLAWSNSISNIKNQNVKIQIKNTKFWGWFFLSILFFATLLYTKSRSGILGFLFASLVFWTLTGFNWLKSKAFLFNFLPAFLLFNFSFLILYIAIGNPFKIYKVQLSLPTNTPTLESGGTESGIIRRIVWKGAIEIWKHYPILGTGPETFAYVYPKYRPVEHNLVSEWKFIYIKAHNEYLNLLANTGILGTLSYLAIIIASLLAISNFQFPISNFQTAILAGYSSLLITNFFNFSVVPTQLLLFLFPAFISTSEHESKRVEEYKLSDPQKIGIVISCSLALVLLYSTLRYWYADTLYAKAKRLNRANNIIQAKKNLLKAISFFPHEPNFHLELADSYAKLGQIELAILEMQKATALSPTDINLKIAEFNLYLKLSTFNQKYLANATTALEQAIQIAPTDAKLFYNLGQVYERLGQRKKAIDTLLKAIEMKSNYKEARLVLSFILIAEKEYNAARDQLNYILEKIDPFDELTKKTLEEIE